MMVFGITGQDTIANPLDYITMPGLTETAAILNKISYIFPVKSC
jgi:hypothetical protein